MNKKHNGNNNEFEFVQDHGPATVAVVWPFDHEPGTRRAELGIRRLGVCTKDTAEDLSIHGYMVVKSATENFSVHEITLNPPFAVDGRIVRGPSITAGRAVEYTCTVCGAHKVTDRANIVRASTKELKMKVERNGRVFYKHVRVAKDDGKSEVWSWKDLIGHRMSCPVCEGYGDVTDVKTKRWSIKDREIVKTDAWETAIKAAMHDGGLNFEDVIPEIMTAKNGTGQVVGIERHQQIVGKLVASMPDIDITSWNCAISGAGMTPNLLVAAPEISVFSVENAQDLATLQFGPTDKTDKLSFKGQIGFRPRDIRKEKPRGITTIGEALDLSIDGLVI